MVSGSFHQEAFGLANQLVTSAVRDGGLCSWIVDRGSEAGVLPGTLEDGTAGVALFLARAGQAEIAGEALAHSLRAQSCPAWVAWRIARLLATEPPPPAQLLAEAPGVPPLQRDALCLRDAAGLFDLGETELARQAARSASERLLGWVERREVEGLTRAEVGLTGGASGVGLALAAWAARAGEPAGFEGARKAFRLERAWHQQGWSRPGCGSLVGLEAGSAGIALARLGFHHWQPGPAALAEAGAALELIRRDLRAPDASDASLATGTCGVIEALLAAFTSTGEAAHLDAARRLGGWLVAAARSRGGYGCSPGYGPDHAALFTGLAGIGLTLLRLEDPHAVPGAFGPLLASSAPSLRS